MKRSLWKVKPLDPQAEILAEKYGIPVFLAQIFINRGVKEEEFNSFLEPRIEDFHSPFLLTGIEKARDRVKTAVNKGEKVLVFGDYDVDGITSLAIFNEFAKQYPGVFSFYIPHRVKEGYGLNNDVVAQAKEEAVTLIITFDCGTNSRAEIELAKSLGIDIIVIDHHTLKGEEIEPLAFINPKQKNEKYPFPELSTGALAFKFLQVLTTSSCREVLDLVVLSLVCDVVPLIGENRALLKEGLEVIKESKRYSIMALCKIAGIKQENIDVFHIGFILGPRINAAGRVAHPQDSLDLFFARTQEDADGIAAKLSEHNHLRRGIEAQILKEAESKIESSSAFDPAIVVAGDKWHVGVLGIVASRLADKYHRPSFVISFDEKIGKGSARSIGNVHLLNILDECADSLIVYGGHSKAAGVHIDKDELENFREKINSFIENNLNPQDFIPSVGIDAELRFKEIDIDLVEWIGKLKPYGEGNSRPLFVSRSIYKKSLPKKIKSYFSLWLSDNERTFEAVIYRKELLDIINYGESLDIVFHLDKNHYHNTPKLIIKDCRLTDDDR